jgi:hypothetical protein
MEISEQLEKGEMSKDHWKMPNVKAQMSKRKIQMTKVRG